MKLTFSEFSIDSETFELHVGNQSVAIDERNVTLLLILAQSYPEHCSKQDCLSQIWQETVVSDMSLSKLVSDTRKLFNQAGYQGPLIQTVHGRGYRLEHVLGKQLVAPVPLELQNQAQESDAAQGTVEPEKSAQSAEPPLQQKTQTSNQSAWWENLAKALIALLLVIGLIFQFWHASSPSHQHVSGSSHEHVDGLNHDKAPARQLAYSELNGATGRILWVDDHPENNLVEKAFFEQKGIGVYSTVTSEEALMLLSMYHYQAVISDMGRHGDSLAGLKLLQSIRASGNKTPFYLYTYVESAGVVDAIDESGGQAVVLDSESLYKLVLSHVEQK
ncbi:transcriptional regulator, CadC [Shewanella halifaxensis HAW-EB4]|uniref:Transcriptional regulator, CadC n=1 Tax=Shewanella halifaxensis (strain HAW-EB4) TaxID=458817 RepID=B0TTI9_SHEHH|nr:winged helix-turn-helix domain-containing protein [Shewanella halifaxensis]ABZ75332.1 transcriptional regulator, CadC [Shewanella halifaxensis HAW-EB4]